jgi:DNA-directed RNA polymerase specialized sigma24 family protein
VNRVDVRAAVTQAHHEEWARVVAALARRFGDLDIAEEAAAEAFATAVGRWPADGVPPSPGAWLTTTANRKAIDRNRRENKLGDKHKEARDRLAGAFRGGYGECRPWPDASPALLESLIAARALHTMNVTLNINGIAGLDSYVAGHAEQIRAWMRCRPGP